MGDYTWLSYDQVAERAHAFGKGLRALGQQPGTSIAMYGETRAEWMISCLGAFSQNIHLCTGIEANNDLSTEKINHLNFMNSLHKSG